MKPILLELQAFGPFRDYERVDFAALASNGLFLISGQTGSGKSTLLDAITFALYGESSGDLRNDFGSMRCTKSGDTVPTFVKFTFALHGKIYRFERIYEKKRTQYSQSQNVLEQNEEGIFEPLFENCKDKDVKAKTNELIGLNIDQFRQVVILPQGKFEKLLTSNSEEKEEILQTIFGIHKWKEIAEILYQNAQKRREESDELKKHILTLLQGEGCETLEALEEKKDALQKEYIQIKADYEASDYPGQELILKVRKDLAKDFVQMHGLQRELRNLQALQSQMDAKALVLQNSDRAELVRPALEEHDRAGKVKKDAAELLGKALAAYKEQEQAFKVAEEAYRIHDGKREAHLQNRDRLTLLKAKKTVYENLSQLEQTRRQAELVRRNADKTFQKAETAFNKAKETMLQAKLEWDAKSLAYRQGVDSYNAGICGELATQLVEQQPCPVCGSISHPAPAPKGENAIGKNQLDALEQLEQAAKQAWAEADKAVGRQEQDYHRAKDAQNKAIQEETLSLANYQNALENRVQGMDDLSQLNGEIARLELVTQQFDREEETLQKTRQDASDAMATIKERGVIAREQDNRAKEDLAKAEENLQVALQQQGFTTDEEVRNTLRSQQERTALLTELTTYKANVETKTGELDAQQRKLAGMEEPDSAELEKLEQSIQTAKKNYLQTTAKMEQTLHRWEDLSAQLTEQADRYQRERPQIETDTRFAKSLRGDTGIGLQRYVLGVMFASVIAAANRMLDSVHNGRYHLLRSDEKTKGKNKSGLELYVYDRQAPDQEKGRSVATLSGGEKFLVSLALSIGLSTVAQRSSIRLDTMFIDEGFGTLDEQSIDDAMEVLQHVRNANGMVGIISHVQVLKDNIPTKIEIYKTGEGSHIVTNFG